MVENPISIHKEDLEEPQVSQLAELPLAHQARASWSKGVGAATLWGGGSFLENLIPLLKVQVHPFQGVQRSPRVVGDKAGRGLPFWVETEGPSPWSRGTCLGHEAGLLLPQPPHCIHQEGHLSEGQEARHVGSRQANHAAVLIHHLSPGTQVTGRRGPPPFGPRGAASSLPISPPPHQPCLSGGRVHGDKVIALQTGSRE